MKALKLVSGKNGLRLVNHVEKMLRCQSPFVMLNQVFNDRMSVQVSSMIESRIRTISDIKIIDKLLGFIGRSDNLFKV